MILRLVHRLWNVPFPMKHTPHINMIFLITIKDDIGVSFQ